MRPGATVRDEGLGAEAQDGEGLQDDDGILLDDADFLEDFARDDADLEGTVGPGVTTAGTDWGAQALEVVQKLLPLGGDLQLYSFTAIPKSKRVDIRLDKLSSEPHLIPQYSTAAA